MFGKIYEVEYFGETKEDFEIKIKSLSQKFFLKKGYNQQSVSWN